MPSRFASACAMIGAAILATGCGGSTQAAAKSPAPSQTTSPIATASPSALPSPAALGAEVDLAMSRYGDVLVDSKGFSLYIFVADRGATSVCYGSCAQIWPPLLTNGMPHAGAGVNASLLGTSTRTDGTTEVTYAGHPLYYFISDKRAGEVTGQAVTGFGGPWYVVGPDGIAIR